MSDTLKTIAVIIVHTPIWVWFLYGLLLILGLQRTKDCAISLPRMLILPLIVTGLAIVGFVGAGLSGLPAILTGLAIGVPSGCWLEQGRGTRRLADGRLWLQGEWLSFTQIVVMLVFRYAINVVPVVAPLLHANPVWHLGSLFISAVLSALFLGRTAERLKVYFTLDLEAAQRVQ